MASKKKMVCQVLKLRLRAIYLTKTPFQLHDALHVESESCDRSGVGIFSCEKKGG